MSGIPWNEAAVLIRVSSETQIGAFRGIEDEGTLREVVARLDTRRVVLKLHKVSLPDRRVPPYGYDVSGIEMLLAAHRQLDGDEPKPRRQIGF